MQRVPHDVYALRYFQRGAQKSREFFHYDLYRQPDEEIGMDYFFWAVRWGSRTVLVDCGFDPGRAAPRNRVQDSDPLELLARMDIKPTDVEHVVLTHMHYDHVGNVGLFPNATFSLAQEEYEYWSGPYGDRELETHLVDREEVRIVEALAKEERLQLVDGVAEPYPGIVLTRVGGHTAGQMIVEIATDTGSVVLASDAMHYYEEIERDRPYNLFNNLGDMYGAYDRLRDLHDRPETVVVAGHDPRVGSMFDLVKPHCFDLTALTGR